MSERNPQSPVLTALMEHAAGRADAVALRYKRHGRWYEVTSAVLMAHVAAYATAMRGVGVAAGADAVVVGDNSIEWVCADLALQALGARPLPLPASTPREVVSQVVATRDLSLVIAVNCEDVLACEALGFEPVLVLDPRGLAQGSATRAVVLPPLGAISDSDPMGALAEVVDWSELNDSGDVVDVDHAEFTVRLDAMLDKLALSARDRTVVVSPLFDLTARIAELYAPLVAGAVVHVPETEVSVPGDLAEVRPTVLAAEARVIEALHLQSQAEFLRSGRLSRWTIDRGFRTYADPRPSRRWSPRRLVTHALAVQHGFDALRLLQVTFQQPTATTTQFFESIGAEVRAPSAAPGSAAVEVLVRESPYVKRAFVVDTDDGLRLMIELHPEMVRLWAIRQGLEDVTLAALSETSEVRELVAGAVTLGAIERELEGSPVTVVILPRTLGPESGYLTLRGRIDADAYRAGACGHERDTGLRTASVAR